MIINNSNIEENSFVYNSRISNKQYDNKLLLQSDINRLSSSQLGNMINDNNNRIGFSNNINNAINNNSNVINNSNLINNKSQ
jgi:hypothetical protein